MEELGMGTDGWAAKAAQDIRRDLLTFMLENPLGRILLTIQCGTFTGLELDPIMSELSKHRGPRMLLLLSCETAMTNSQDLMFLDSLIAKCVEIETNLSTFRLNTGIFVGRVSPQSSALLPSPHRSCDSCAWPLAIFLPEDGIHGTPFQITARSRQWHWSIQRLSL